MISKTEYNELAYFLTPYFSESDLEEKIKRKKDSSYISILKSIFHNDSEQLKRFIMKNSISIKSVIVQARMHSDVTFELDINHDVDEEDLDEYIENNFREDDCEIDFNHLSNISKKIQDKFIMKKYEEIN